MRDISRAFGGGVFVDVGANTGLHSLYMSKHASTVHAFEPYEPVLARLRAAIARNEIGNIYCPPTSITIKGLILYRRLGRVPTGTSLWWIWQYQTEFPQYIITQGHGVKNIYTPVIVDITYSTNL